MYFSPRSTILKELFEKHQVAIIPLTILSKYSKISLHEKGDDIYIKDCEISSYRSLEKWRLLKCSDGPGMQAAKFKEYARQVNS